MARMSTEDDQWVKSQPPFPLKVTTRVVTENSPCPQVIGVLCAVVASILKCTFHFHCSQNTRTRTHTKLTPHTNATLAIQQPGHEYAKAQPHEQSEAARGGTRFASRQPHLATLATSSHPSPLWRACYYPAPHIFFLLRCHSTIAWQETSLGDDERTINYACQALWLAGLFLVVLASAADFAALFFAKQSLIAPLGSRASLK